MSSSKPAQPKTSKTSSCLCEQVRVTVTGNDKGSVVCHCVNCQRGGGSAFAYNHFMTNAEVQYESGKDVIKSYTDKATQSGHALHRHFCSNCGGNLFAKPDQTKGLIVMSVGALEGPKSAPKREFFKENKEKWLGEITAQSAKM